nr:PQQ-binding-like beta-propeller repeat protein [Terriglobales bacterium]
MKAFRSLLVTAILAGVMGSTALAHAQVVQWPVAGQSAANLRSQPAESFITTTNVASMVPKWIFTTKSDVSATPTVGPSTVFVPDASGALFAIDLATGKQLWSHQISDYDGYAGANTRVSPALYKKSIIIGDSESTTKMHNGANVIAVDQQTGNLLWITQVDPHPAAIVTGSPVVVGSVVYQPISSMEEALSLDNNYACCTFRGSVVALDADTGKKLWQTFTVPDNLGKAGAYSGAPIWQPPAIDATRNLLYAGTGNNYSVPASVETCRKNDPNNNNCAVVADHFDSALALDLTTGAVKWAHRLSGYDVYTAACRHSAFGTPCPDPAGPDYDLSGSGPNIVGNIVGFSQKSGLYAALNPDTGATVYLNYVGPAGPLGGIQWGTASDGKNVYVANANSSGKTYKLLSGQQITWGFWSAIDAATGKILWQTADPISGTKDEGAVSVANGIVYAPSYDAAGHAYALNSATGAVLWSYPTGGSIIDGPSIVAGNVIWGSGYRKIPPGTGNNKVYDFTPAPAVTVSSPINGATVASPVQFTATASSPNCSKGIDSMLIYTAPGVLAYSVKGSSLSTTLPLATGTYNTVVQSFDNCGNVGKTFVTITVSEAGR